MLWGKFLEIRVFLKLFYNKKTNGKKERKKKKKQPN